MTFEMSRFPPGLRAISFTPILRNDIGDSSLRTNGEDFISTSVRLVVLIYKGKSTIAGFTLFTSISKKVLLSNPI
jgi:hypothetical protein